MKSQNKLELFKRELEQDTVILRIDLDRFAGVKLDIKREDQNHPLVQGNKWHKLKLNIEAFLSGDYKCILTFGGAFSNHIYATAGLCYYLGIPCIVYIRGYHLDKDNPTVKQLLLWNAQLFVIEPSVYKDKSNPEFITGLKEKHSGAFIIPEGGSNDLGFKGMLSFAEKLKVELEVLPDYLCISSGTGASAAAFISSFESTVTRVLVFSSLKGYDFKKTIKEDFGIDAFNWKLIDNYHFGGYARVNVELVDYINSFYKATGVPLDPVYTGKMLYGIEDLIKNGKIAPGSRVLAIHSGGLQGSIAHNYLNGSKRGKILTK